MIKSIIDYWQRELGVPNTASLTLIVTITTFTLAFIINWTAAAYIRGVKKRRYRSSLKVIINDFLQSCKKQHEYLQKALDQKGFLHGQNYVIKMKSNFAQDYLNGLDVSVFIENFSVPFKKNRPTEIAKLFELVSDVKSIKDSLTNTMSMIQTKYHEYSDTYNKGLFEIRNIHDKLIQKYFNVTDDPMIDFVNGLHLIFKKWQDAGGVSHMQTTLDEIVMPVYNYARPIINDYTLDLLNHTLDCQHAISNMKVAEDVLRNEIKTGIELYDKAFTKGTEILNNWK